MRIILYLGKGGVGKTTIAAATAVRSAKMGKRTLVVSTDLAHSLADCLNTPLASYPKELSPNLWAQEVNVLDEMRRGWSKVQDAMSKVLRKQGLDEVMAEELALIPGMDEIVSLTNIYRNAREGNFEVVIIDAAPTGETVRLLSMPDTFQWYVGRITSSAALNLARPLIKAVMPSAEILDAVQLLSERVKTLREVLSNPDISSYRPVVNPERMVIKETLRAETYLALFGYIPTWQVSRGHLWRTRPDPGLLPWSDPGGHTPGRRLCPAPPLAACRDGQGTHDQEGRRDDYRDRQLQARYHAAVCLSQPGGHGSTLCK